MMNRSIYLMTGITSGLGLVAAQNILKSGNTTIITGVRSQAARSKLQAALPQQAYIALDLDQASLGSVRAFCQSVKDHLGDKPLAGMVLNAGLQIMSGLEKTTDGIETTFAVNHLSHWAIHDRLQLHLAERARIIFTASGTHDPNDPVASKFGFRGGLYPSGAAVADGLLDSNVDETQQCLDRYATSKLCNLMTMAYLAEANKASSRQYLAYDPGLMPGTQLARERSALERFAWHNIMPLVAPMMKGVSSAKRSGKMLASLAVSGVEAATGDYIEFSGNHLTPADLARSKTHQADLMDLSARLTY